MAEILYGVALLAGVAALSLWTWSRQRKLRLAREMARWRNKDVVVYTSPTCDACRQVKEWLASRGVSFIEKNVDADDNAREELVHKYQRMAVPTTVIGGEKVVFGFEPDDLAKGLGI